MVHVPTFEIFVHLTWNNPYIIMSEKILCHFKASKIHFSNINQGISDKMFLWLSPEPPAIFTV